MKKKPSSSCQAGKDLSEDEVGRATRVKTIKQAVESGTYKTDDRVLANSLLIDLLWEEWEKKRLAEPD
jgi:anti-sigma28 factor (negative regulator of flagellin synthesis)